MRFLLKCFTLTAILFLLQSTFVFGAEYLAFGSYPQSRVDPDAEITGAAYNADNDGQAGSNKYRRVLNDSGEYEYFKYEPLYWEVINTGSETLLLSKDIIDSKKYDEQEDKYVEFNGGLKYASPVTWEESSLRSWLNSEFYNTAFSSEEKAKINMVSYDNVRLLTSSEAENVDTSSLKKVCSDYALSQGAMTYSGIYSDDNGSWLLKDASPVLSSALCHITYDGSVEKGMTLLVSDEGYGIVPCISLSSLEGISVYTENTENEVYVYKPYGEVLKTTEAQKESYLNSGWYESPEEAETHLSDIVNENFKKLSVYDLYAPFVTSYAREGNSKIYLECRDMNLSNTDIIRFLYPLVNEALTGDPSDYMEISVKFSYDPSYGTSLDDFHSKFAENALKAVYTCWSNWGGIINTGDSAYGYDNSTYNIIVNLTINCAVNDYYNKLNEIASSAKNYSDKPLGQIQYIRNYLAENVHYDSKIFSNNPDRLLLYNEGVCGNYAHAVNDLCFMLDIPCFVVSNSEANHARNCLFIEGAWHELDTTSISSASYTVNGNYREFTEGKFSDSEATADNVSFFDRDLGYFPLKYGTNPGDDVSSRDFEEIKNLFTKGFTSSDFTNKFTIPESPAGSSVKIFVNDSLIIEQKKPFIENGRILVPMRAIFESLGANVSWNASSKTVTAVKDNTVISLQIGNSLMYINKTPLTMDTAPISAEGQTLVPLRAVAEALNAEVSWDSNTRTVNIYG